ncbi:hypothetical protein P2318_00815 [Myxococcaceae bacterium GXIMD 01537]
MFSPFEPLSPPADRGLASAPSKPAALTEQACARRARPLLLGLLAFFLGVLGLVWGLEPAEAPHLIALLSLCGGVVLLLLVWSLRPEARV